MSLDVVEAGAPSVKLYVGGLSYSTTSDNLREYAASVARSSRPVITIAYPCSAGSDRRDNRCRRRSGHLKLNDHSFEVGS
jgi:hypothetical protein